MTAQSQNVQIPDGWDVRRLKFIASCNDEVLSEATDPALEIDYVDISSVELEVGIKSVDRLPFDEAPSRARRIVRDGDTIVSTVRTYLRAIAAIRDPSPDLVVSTGFAVLRPMQDLDGRFLAYALQASSFVDAVVANSTGVSYPAINPSELVCLPILFPHDKGTQGRIADFLDWKTGQIDALIAKKRKLIEKLKEKRVSVITQAVTKGLDSSVPLKDSGVPWLGEVPGHWDVKRLSRITESRCDGPFGSGLKSEHYADAGVRVVRLQNIGVARFDGSDAAFIDPEYYAELGNHDVHEGDLLVAGLGDKNNPVGRACRAPGLGDAMVKADCFRYRLEVDKADTQFIAYQMSVVADALAGAMASGVTRPRMNLSLTSERVLALPDLPEQVRIAKYLDQIWSETENVIEKVEAAMSRIGEYRSALITAAVTGKLNVHKLAIPTTA